MTSPYVSRTRPFALALLLALTLAAPRAVAAPPAVQVGPLVGAPAATTFASYWHGFIDHWSEAFKKQSGVIMIALGLGAVSLFIITRGKWRK